MLAAKSSATSRWMSKARTARRSKRQDRASRLLRPCTPQAMMPADSLSGRARYLAATAVAAPVRCAVIQVASMIAVGRPVSGSLRISRPLM